MTNTYPAADRYADACVEASRISETVLESANHYSAAMRMTEMRPQHEASIRNFANEARRSETEFHERFGRLQAKLAEVRRRAAELRAEVPADELIFAMSISQLPRDTMDDVAMIYHWLHIDFGNRPSSFIDGVHRANAAIAAAHGQDPGAEQGYVIEVDASALPAAPGPAATEPLAPPSPAAPPVATSPPGAHPLASPPPAAPSESSRLSSGSPASGPVPVGHTPLSNEDPMSPRRAVERHTETALRGLNGLTELSRRWADRAGLVSRWAFVVMVVWVVALAVLGWLPGVGGVVLLFLVGGIWFVAWVAVRRLANALESAAAGLERANDATAAQRAEGVDVNRLATDAVEKITELVRSRQLSLPRAKEANQLFQKALASAGTAQAVQPSTIVPGVLGYLVLGFLAIVGLLFFLAGA